MGAACDNLSSFLKCHNLSTPSPQCLPRVLTPCPPLWRGPGLWSPPADPLTPPADQYCPIWPLLFLASIPAESAPFPPALVFRSPRWDRPGTAASAAKSDSFKERRSLATRYTQHGPRDLFACATLFAVPTRGALWEPLAASFNREPRFTQARDINRWPALCSRSGTFMIYLQGSRCKKLSDPKM